MAGGGGLQGSTLKQIGPNDNRIYNVLVTHVVFFLQCSYSYEIRSKCQFVKLRTFLHKFHFEQTFALTITG